MHSVADFANAELADLRDEVADLKQMRDELAECLSDAVDRMLGNGPVIRELRERSLAALVKARTRVTTE